MSAPFRFSLKPFLFLIPAVVFAGCKPEVPVPKDMVLIPKGEFIMGSDEVDKDAKSVQYGSNKPWYANEKPSRKVMLDDFYMDKTEVTNASYKEFVDATKHRVPDYWQNGAYPANGGKHPVTNVDWHDADEFCKWKGKRLPTEAEWEKAARGTDGRRFPWGDEFDIKKVNTSGEYKGITPVGSFPGGASPYGLLDMAGNVWEWTNDWYKRFPNNTYDDPEYGETYKVAKGGSWGGIGHYTVTVYVRSAYRGVASPTDTYGDVGFRCAWSR